MVQMYRTKQLLVKDFIDNELKTKSIEEISTYYAQQTLQCHLRRFLKKPNFEIDAVISRLFLDYCQRIFKSQNKRLDHPDEHTSCSS